MPQAPVDIPEELRRYNFMRRVERRAEIISRCVYFLLSLVMNAVLLGIVSIAAIALGVYIGDCGTIAAILGGIFLIYRLNNRLSDWCFARWVQPALECRIRTKIRIERMVEELHTDEGVED